MSIAKGFLHEIDMEVATTRKVLERVPEDKLDWVPHEKSMTMGSLASHVSEIMSWIPSVMGQDSLDVAPPDGPAYTPPEHKSVASFLTALETSASTAKDALQEAGDEGMMSPWSLLRGGEVLFTAPRVGVMRSLVFNHLVHHRAQLGVYLRLNDIPVPSTFGPSADEDSF